MREAIDLLRDKHRTCLCCLMAGGAESEGIHHHYGLFLLIYAQKFWWLRTFRAALRGCQHLKKQTIAHDLQTSALLKR